MATYATVPTSGSYADWFAPPPPAGGGGGGRKPPPGDPFGYGGGYDIGGTGYQTDASGNPGPTKTASGDPYDPNGATFGTPSQWATGGAQPQPWDPNSDPNGVLSGPGYDEKWYQDHGSAYDAPSNAENYWNGVSGTFAAGPARATGAKAGYDNWFDQLGTPGFTAAGAGSSHGSDYGAGAYGNRDTGLSRSENFENAGGPQFSNYGAGSYGAGGDRTTFDAGQTFSRFFDPLSQESNSEKLYGQDPGLGAYYDRASQTGQEKIDNVMAARGLFGSGAAIDESRQLNADLGADRAKNEADYKLRAAGQSDAERRARMGLAGQLGSAADASSLGSSQNERGWVSMLDDNELKQAQEKRAGREFADTSAANRDTRNMNWADMLDKNTLAKSAQDLGWATAADANAVNRSGEARNWSDLLDKETNDNNKSTLDYATAGGNLAAGSDAGKYGRLADQRTGAVTAQNSMTKRYQDQFDNLFAMAKAKSGTITNAVDAANKEKLDLIMEKLKSELAAATNGANLSNEARDRIEGYIADATKLLG